MSDVSQKLPNPIESAWLQANYKLYNRYFLAKHLAISSAELTVWMRHLYLNDPNGKKSIITAEQKQFIHEKYMDLSQKEIAIQIDLAVTVVQRYCIRNGYGKLKHGNSKTAKSNNKPSRPRTEYDNVSHEERINDWISKD
jgi:hypothetical protein